MMNDIHNKIMQNAHKPTLTVPRKAEGVLPEDLVEASKLAGVVGVERFAVGCGDETRDGDIDAAANAEEGYAVYGISVIVEDFTNSPCILLSSQKRALLATPPRSKRQNITLI